MSRKKKRNKKKKSKEKPSNIGKCSELVKEESVALPELLEKPSLKEMPRGLAPLLLDNENVIVLISGNSTDGPAYLGVTEKRAFYFRVVECGVEIKECRLKKRPLVDSLEKDDGWTITITADQRLLELRAIKQSAASRFCEALDEQVASLGVGKDTWETLSADHNLWDEMRHYLDPVDNDKDEADEKEDKERKKDDGEIDELQQDWIKKGALKSDTAWWPPSAATLVWLLPLLLLLWMVHTIIIASTSEPSAATKTSILISRARSGDALALNQLAYRLPKEKNPELKISIARLLAQNSPPGAADMLLQDIFSHNHAKVRQEEMQTLFKMNLGRELVARVTMPGSIELKKALILDLGNYDDTSITSDLKEYYQRAERPLRPVLLNTLARLGQADFLIDTYKKGTTDIRENCLDAVYCLKPKARKRVLKAFLDMEVAADRRQQIEDLLKR